MAPTGGSTDMVNLAVLDVNGTLFSLDVIADRLAEVGLAGQLPVWFARILRDGFATAVAGTFATFPDLARHHLAVLLDEHGLPVSDDRLDRVIDGFTQVHAHPDVRAGLQRLADAGVTAVTMTNGTVEITRAFLEREGLDGLVAEAHDVGMARRWKPAPEAYRHVLDQHDVSPQEAALVAVHPWDVHGAATAGLATGWVNRSGARYPEMLAAPDVRGSSLDEVVDGLLGPGS